MDATFLGLLDTQVEGIKKAGDPKSANEMLLKTVKLLLDNVDDSDNTLSKYENRDEMRKLFSDFGKVAGKACNFYSKSKNHLDPVALNGEIGKSIEKATKELSEIIAKLESIEQEEARLEGIVKERKTLEESLSKTFAKINEKKKTIEENIIDKISGQHDKIREIFTSHSKDLDLIIEEIISYKKQYEKLNDIFPKAREECRFYRLHLGENSKIAKKLKEYGINSIDNFLSEIERIDNTVKDELNKFDGIIKSIIVEQEELKSKIEKAQNK